MGTTDPRQRGRWRHGRTTWVPSPWPPLGRDAAPGAGAIRNAVAVGSCLLWACLPYGAVEDPAPPVTLPPQYGSGDEVAAGDRPTDGEGWWHAFGDAELDALIAAALADNLDLAAAWARLAQADAMAAAAGAPRWPQLGLEFTASRARRTFVGPSGPGGATASTAIETNSFGLSAPASFELDLFGRLGANARAAALDRAASAEDVRAMTVTLSAQVAETYFDRQEVIARRQVLARQEEINGTFFELVRLRFAQGLSSALDVYQQEQQVEAIRAQLVAAELQQVVLEQQLAVLTGRPPARRSDDEAAADDADVGASDAGDGPEERTGANDGAAAGPPTADGDAPAGSSDAGVSPESPRVRLLVTTLPAPPALGVPTDLLDHRPDIRAARMRVEAADQRVGAAIAAYFPSLRLSGSIGFSATEIADLFADFVYSAIAAVQQSLFDGGQRGAEVDRHRAIVQERLAQYGKAVLGALLEIESALIQERLTGQRLTHLGRQAEIAEAALREARTRYREGLSDFLPVLTSLVSLQQSELALLAGERQLLAHRIQLSRALGGNLPSELAPIVLEPPRGRDEAQP